jgi:hypothetical protein
MSSEFPPKADLTHGSRHFAFVPLPDASVRKRRYRPMSADREAALVARTINLDDVVKAWLFRGEAQRKSSWQFGD